MLIINKRSDREKLNNSITFIDNLIKNKTVKNISTIFTIVKLYADKINISNNIDKISGNYERHYDKYLFNMENQIFISETFNVELGKDPILPLIWNRERLISCLDEVGTISNPWKKHILNHRYHLFLPMGLTVVYNGNHSVNSGIIKKVGMLDYNFESDNIFDISHLYQDVYYDGTFYRLSHKNKKLVQTPFEYGCLFEIGRILKNNGISYLDYKLNK